MILITARLVEYAYPEVDANPSKKTSEVIAQLKLILDEETAGDPMTSQKWVRWWQRQDRPEFVQENRLLILCDARGSNGYRIHNWKQQLQLSFVDRFNVEVMVCHYPTGASKWNPIEHRLFSFISLN